MSRSRPRNRGQGRDFGGRFARIEVRQAVAGLLMNPARAVAAVAGLAVGSAVLVAGWHAHSLGSGGRWAGVLLLGLVAGVTASAADPRQFRAAAVLDLVGATGTQRRAVVVIEAALLGLAALPPGLAAGWAVASASGTKAPSVGSVVACTLLVPMAVATRAGRARTRVTAVDARGGAPVTSNRRFDLDRLHLRVLAGVVMIGFAFLAVSGSKSWTDLDLVLWPGILLASLGLALLIAPILDGVANVLGRLPSIATNLSGALLRSRRGMLTPAIVLGAVGAFAVAVQAMLGAGLARREDDRRQVLTERYDFSAGLRPQQVIVERDSLIMAWGTRIEPANLPALPDDAVPRIRAARPDAVVVAPIEFVDAMANGDPMVPTAGGRTVAWGTPELLAALDLERFADDLAAGRAVALDPSAVVDGRVDVRGMFEGERLLPAVVADGGRIPVHLPAVLLPPELRSPSDTGSSASTSTRALLVRLAAAATPDDTMAMVAALRPAMSPPDSSGLRAWTGAESEPGLLEDGRLDASGVVGLRRSGETRLAVALVALVAVIGLLVTLRLAAVTRRSDEEVIELVGARPMVLRRIAAYQAAVLTGLAVSLGLALGIVLTRLGLARYNGDGRFGSGQGGTDLPPIPVIVPPVLLVAVVAVPLATAALAWLLGLAGRRPRLSPSTVADGLLW